MANQEHLDLLKQGVKVWNQWREEHPDIQPDLSAAKLANINLRRIRLGERGIGANLTNVDFSDANLSWADLVLANLTQANLSRADIGGAQLFGVLLINANLSGTWLTDTNLTEANLKGAIFHQANVRRTLFTNVDLREVQSLETIQHHGPSSIGLDTIYRSQGEIPESFLRGVGISDLFITYMRSLVYQPIEFYSCFISYSSKDQEFAERLYTDLQSKNVRCWYAPEDLKIGDKFWHRIDESIRLHDKLLVILSEHSVASAWVENEVMAALEKEHKQPNTTVLFPIKLDTTIMDTNLPWAANMRRTRHIGDFTRWEEHDEYQKGLSRLLRALKAGS